MSVPSVIDTKSLLIWLVSVPFVKLASLESIVVVFVPLLIEAVVLP